jgi:hypothetical protein
MKSKREEFLDAEYARMRKRAQEERAKIEYQQFIEDELMANARNRLDPKWRKQWDLFHEKWSKTRLPQDTTSPFYKRKLDRNNKQ